MMATQNIKASIVTPIIAAEKYSFERAWLFFDFPRKVENKTDPPIPSIILDYK